MLNYKGKKRGQASCSGWTTVINLRPSVCHCSCCCSRRFTASRASVSAWVQEAQGLLCRGKKKAASSVLAFTPGSCPVKPQFDLSATAGY